MNNLRWTLAALLLTGGFLICSLIAHPLIAPPSY